MDFYKFNLTFKGQLVENSVDAFDVANTILATSYSLQEIAIVKLGEEQSKNLKLNISAFKEGSLKSEFMYHFLQVTAPLAPLLPYAPNIYDTSKKILDGLSTYVNIKKLLKGKPPESVKAIDGQNVQINIGDGSTVNITYNDFRLLQNHTLGKNVAKAIQPLLKEDSPLDEIQINDEESKQFIEIKKEEAQYLGLKDSFQILPTVKYKGMVTKIDSKVRSGYINVGQKRIPFTYSDKLSDQDFITLIESLKRKIQIYLIGDVTMDYESNPKSILVNKVESEIQMF